MVAGASVNDAADEFRPPEKGIENMNDVKIKRIDLLNVVTTNRDAHRDQFLQAQAGFRERVVEELDAMLADAKAGKALRTSVRLVAPEDHTADYNRAIAMLEMSIDYVIDINQLDFAQLVRNEWAWFARASHVNTLYASGLKMDA